MVLKHWVQKPEKEIGPPDPHIWARCVVDGTWGILLPSQTSQERHGQPWELNFSGFFGWTGREKGKTERLETSHVNFYCSQWWRLSRMGEERGKEIWFSGWHEPWGGQVVPTGSPSLSLQTQPLTSACSLLVFSLMRMVLGGRRGGWSECMEWILYLVAPLSWGPI